MWVAVQTFVAMPWSSECAPVDPSQTTNESSQLVERRLCQHSKQLCHDATGGTGLTGLGPSHPHSLVRLKTKHRQTRVILFTKNFYCFVLKLFLLYFFFSKFIAENECHLIYLKVYENWIEKTAPMKKF